MGSLAQSVPFPSPHSICPGAGQGALDGDPLVAPIVQSTTFARDSVGSTAEHQYSRVSNPSVSALERALGDLEGALPAACFSSGLAAETALFLSVLRAGDHAICGRSVYGGTTRLFRQLLADLGVETTFVDATDENAIAAAVRTNTKLLFVETPANPTLELTDIDACARIAKRAGAILAVDNTFLTPVLQRPLDLGADVSVYSTTKFIEGHSVATGGSLVTRDEPLLQRIRFIRKCTGAIQSPFNAWLTLNGLRTLPLRIERQSDTAREIAHWLSDQPGISAVHYPSLSCARTRSLAAKQHLRRDGAVVSFEIAGGLRAAQAFARRLKRCALVEHVGSTQTLITHPASMTHADVPQSQRVECNVTDGLLRLSVGLEPARDIINDLEQALAFATFATTLTTDAKEATPCATR